MTHEAIEAGFTLPMEISSKKTTRYVRHEDDPSGISHYKQVCNHLGGVQVHEYDNEVTQALNGIGGLTPKRPLALIRQPTETGGVITLWDNGMQHWDKDLLATGCPQYSWTDNNWLNNNIYTQIELFISIQQMGHLFRAT